MSAVPVSWGNFDCLYWPDKTVGSFPAECTCSEYYKEGGWSEGCVGRSETGYSAVHSSFWSWNTIFPASLCPNLLCTLPFLQDGGLSHTCLFHLAISHTSWIILFCEFPPLCAYFPTSSFPQFDASIHSYTCSFFPFAVSFLKSPIASFFVRPTHMHEWCVGPSSCLELNRGLHNSTEAVLDCWGACCNSFYMLVI